MKWGKRGVPTGRMEVKPGDLPRARAEGVLVAKTGIDTWSITVTRECAGQTHEVLRVTGSYVDAPKGHWGHSIVYVTTSCGDVGWVLDAVAIVKAWLDAWEQPGLLRQFRDLAEGMFAAKVRDWAAAKWMAWEGWR